jgi:hypothetical protein
MNKMVLVVLAVSGWLALPTRAQPVDPPPRTLLPAVEVIAKTYLDSVVIRWAPNQAKVWDYGNRYGYVVERAILARGNQYTLTDPPTVTLTSEPLKPQPLATWEPLAQRDKYAAVAAQAIYGTSFEVVDPSGSLASLVNRAKETENRFSFALFAADQSVATARAHGLRFVDRNVRADEKYRYRVRLALPPTVPDSIETGSVFLSVRDTVPIPAPQQLRITFGDRAAQLSWNKRYYEHVFTSYLVERTDDLAKGFSQLEQPPLVNPTVSRTQSPERMYSTDSLPNNATTYYYRLRGVTPFGEISPPSDTVSGRGVPPGLSVAPSFTKHTLLPTGAVQLQWKLDTTYQKQLRGFHLLRASRADGPVDTLTTQLLPPSARNYTDTIPLPVNYYQIVAVDQQGRTSESFPTLVQLEDSIPPAAPVALSGSIDTLGAVSIRWRANGEPDLSGYRVLMSNAPNGPFLQVSDALVTDSVYHDTTVVLTLTRFIYYRVVAVDYHHNRSASSETLRLARPDVVPPAAAVVRRAESLDSAVYLAWYPSASADVVRHTLYRRREGQANWTTLAGFYSTTVGSSFRDSTAVPGRTYEYTLVATDAAGLESPPAPPAQVAHIDDGRRPAITEFYSKVDRTAKRVELAWSYPTEQVERYLLFRQAAGQPLRLLKSVPGARSTYEDRQLRVNTAYTYRLQAIYRDGGQSPLSEELTVRY